MPSGSVRGGKIIPNVIFPRRLRVGAALGLAVALVAAGAGAARAGTGCQLKRITSIDAKVTPDSRLLIAAKLGETPVWLQLDTGAWTSGLSGAVVRRLGLRTYESRVQFAGIDGQLDSGETLVPKLTLGTAVSSDQQFAITGVGGDGTNDRPVGLFGADYLRNYDVEIDPAGGKVNLYSHDHCPGQVVYWASDYFMAPFELNDSSQITLDAEIDGRNVTALLDTGASGNLLDQETARQRFGVDRDTPGLSDAGSVRGLDGRPSPVSRYRFKSLSVGGLTINNPELLIAAMQAPKAVATGTRIRQALDAEMIVGMRLLSKLHLYIAYGEKKIYYTLAGEARPQN